MGLCRAASPSPTESSRDAFWPPHCSPDGIYARFRTDSSLFNLRRLLARTKTIEELNAELLFADDCALLAHTEEALRYIVNHFSDAAKNFGLTISLKKTEMLYKPLPREAYSPPHISIHGINLNAVEQSLHLPG